MAGVALYALARSGADAPCAFLAITGAPCPGCGMTRAGMALLCGEVAASLRHHPLVLPLALVSAAALAMGILEAATGRPVLRRAAARLGLALAVAGLVLLAGVWLVRVVIRPDWSPDPIARESPAGRLLLR